MLPKTIELQETLYYIAGFIIYKAKGEAGRQPEPMKTHIFYLVDE
jgi:hypothetical protein